MSNNKPNTAVQIMPLMLIAASVVYYVLGTVFFSSACFVLGILFWVVVWHDTK